MDVLNYNFITLEKSGDSLRSEFRSVKYQMESQTDHLTTLRCTVDRLESEKQEVLDNLLKRESEIDRLSGIHSSQYCCFRNDKGLLSYFDHVYLTY
jgi:hypothetical protein